MRLRTFVVALCLVGLLAADVLSAAATYRLYKARRTFVPDKGHPNPFGRSDVLAADFLTTGFTRPDGSDIKVFAGSGNRLADFKVIMMGPGDRARIAVRMIRGVNEYHVCYGGPRNTTAGKWEPRVGLGVETRRFNGGDVGTLAKMRALVAKSGPSYGTWFVPNIFQGFNLFGPSDGYVSIYRGWLHVPKDGSYRFATTSDDASYFLVDGKLVSRKSYWGRGPANARFAGPALRLTAGAHQVEYLHVEGRDVQFCVGAWQPPGGRFGLIPPEAFPGVFLAKQTGLQVAGSRIPIDLVWRADGEVIYERHHLHKVKFTDVTPAGASKPYRAKWFFGDGTSSEERDPEHVYFLPGEYVVTFALVRGGAASRIRQAIVVGEDWEHQGLRRRGQKRLDTSARYYRLVKDYDFKAMRAGQADAALEFFVTLGRDREIINVAAALLAKKDDIVRRKVYRYSVLLGERLRDLKKLPRDALVVFRAAVQRESTDVNKAKLIRRIGDTLLYALKKPDEALIEYQKILGQYGKLEDNVVRLAQLRLGDVYKAKGDHDRALAAYKKTASMLTYQRSYAVNSVRRGAFAQSIEGYLKQKQFTEAQDMLDMWGWEHPVDRLEGEWSLFAAKVALAKGDRASAIREAVECADVNKAGPHADGLLVLAGRLYVEERLGADAVKIARRIQKDYPESGHQQEAALLECEGLLLDKQYHEAAKKAAAGYAKYIEGEGVAKFLLVAARASLASKDRDLGIKLLRLIVKDHPRSDEAKAARARLEALGIKRP